MDKPIVGPLRKTRISTLIVIDVLDECRDEEPTSSFLSVLPRYEEKVPLAKLFITGGPEPPVCSGI
ncbi:hypothetical protein BDM02DRAFT_3100668 [Thelephora ganbajun]|uniref:Uncharacterized protein n=1 Tax=Thelephora ganbajun TaxID=370292 RepID=A0ACB6Z881_THEGA|nr:hypothetical protein BDM02DRAFT_3100668 [Thelephora ganbajun]